MNQRKEELRKRRKGFVSLLTAALLVTQMMPMGAWAVDLDYSEIAITEYTGNEYYQYGGKAVKNGDTITFSKSNVAQPLYVEYKVGNDYYSYPNNSETVTIDPELASLDGDGVNYYAGNQEYWLIKSLSTTSGGLIGAINLLALPAEKCYQITYILNGGTNDANNPDFYYSPDQDTFDGYPENFTLAGTTINPPTRDGYVFDGWTCTATNTTAEYGRFDRITQDSATKVLTIPANKDIPATSDEEAQYLRTYGDITLTAKWKRDLGSATSPITVEFGDTLVYNGEDQKPTITVKDGTTVLSPETDYDITYVETEYRTDAGTYHFTITPKADSAYAGTYNGTFDITKKDLTIKPANQTITYGDNAPATYEITYDGFVGEQSLDSLDVDPNQRPSAACTYQKGSDAGQYDIVPDISDLYNENEAFVLSNYKPVTQNGTLTVSQKPITVTAKNQTVDLGGTIQQGADQITVSEGGLLDGHKITGVTLTADTSNATSDGVISITEGSVKIVDAQEKDVTANYTITSVNGSLTVNRAEIGDIKITFPQTDETIPYNNDGETTDIPAFPYGTSVAPDISGAPDHAETTITYYRYLTDEEWDEVIEKYDLDPENPDEEALSAALAETFGGEYEGDGIMRYTEDDPPTFPGIYEAFAEAEIPDNDNYEHSYTDEIFAIIPKPLTVIPASISLTYGDNLPETGKFTYDGIVKGDEDLFPAELPIDCDYTQYGDAKLYQDAVKLKTDALDAELKNYTLTSASADLTVQPKDIILTWDEFLTPTYDGKAHSMTYSIPEDSILNNDDVTIKLNGATETDAGAPYTASAELVGDKKDNYNLIAENLAWGIEKAPITPSVTIADWAYGAEPNEPVVEGNPGNGKVTYTYFDMDDNELEGVPTGVGTYIVKATIAETANYAEGKAKTVFEITKAEIQKDDPTFQIITKPFEGVYDGKAHAVSVSAPAQIAGAKVYFSATDQTEEEFVEANQTASPEYINAGEYTVYYCITSPHYETVFGTATVTIQKRGITVTAVDQSSTLGEALKSLTYRLDGEIVKGDDLGIKLTSDADKDTLGTSEIKVTYTENANYTVKTVDGTYTVAEASAPPSDPEEPASGPEEPASDPEEPASDPEEPASDPEEPASDPGEPASDPEEPASDPEEPASEPGSEPASEPASTPGSTPSTKTSTDAASTPASEPASTPASDPASTPATKATTAATTKSTTTATTKTTTAVTTKTTTAATTKTTTTASTNSTTDASTTVPTSATTPASTKDTTPSTTSSTPASTLPTTQDTDACTTTAATTTTQPSTEDGTDDVNTTTAPETTDDSGTGKTPHTTEPVLVEYDLKLTVIGKDKAYYAHDPNVFKAEDLIASLRRRTVSTDGQMCEWQDVTDFSCIDMRGQSPQSLYNEAQKNFIFAPIKADITTTLPDGRVVKQEISLGSVLIAQEGDVNLDGKLNALDSYIVQVNAALAGAGLPTQYFGGDDEELERFARFIADVNGDGIADSIDAQAMLMFAAYLGSGEQPTWAKILEILFSNT